MNDFVLSLIRTYVPIGVGAVAAWLITLGVTLDGSTRGALVAGLTGLLTGVYYTVIRALEKKFPWVGVFLGKASAPVYVEPEKITPGNAANVTIEITEKVDNVYTDKSLF